MQYIQYNDWKLRMNFLSNTCKVDNKLIKVIQLYKDPTKIIDITF